MKFIIAIFLLFSSFSFSQESYANVDKHAENIKYKGDLHLLTDDLVAPFDNDIDKVRAIYFWITENIRYDYNTYNKGTKVIRFTCSSQADCTLKKTAIRKKIRSESFDSKKRCLLWLLASIQKDV